MNTSCFLLCLLISSVVSITDPKSYYESKPSKFFGIGSRTCNCIDIVDCPILLDLLLYRPLKDQSLLRLQDATCGLMGTQPYVCCPRPVRKGQNRFGGNVPIINTLLLDEENVPNIDEENYGISNNPRAQRHYNMKPRINNVAKNPQVDENFGVIKSNDTNNGGDYNTSIESNINLKNETHPDEDGKEIFSPNYTKGLQLFVDKKCGLSLQGRIYGGKFVSLGTYPWIARLGYIRKGVPEYLYRCGGSLINSRYVITAAHCVNHSQLRLATVRLGELDSRSDIDCDHRECIDPRQDFKPSAIIVHDDYGSSPYKNDIALIRLDRPADMTPYVSPICLPFDLVDNPKNWTGIRGTVAGWGVSNMRSTARSPALQHVDLDIIDNEACAKIYEKRFSIPISEGQLCAGGKEAEDACEGDSGGPLMKMTADKEDEAGISERYELLGLVSIGARACGTEGIPGVYTRITSYLQWIVEHVQP